VTWCCNTRSPFSDAGLTRPCLTVEHLHGDRFAAQHPEPCDQAIAETRLADGQAEVTAGEDGLDADNGDGGHTAEMAAGAAECEPGTMTRDDPDEPPPADPAHQPRHHVGVRAYCAHCSHVAERTGPGVRP
jgi:hypothetical protein